MQVVNIWNCTLKACSLLYPEAVKSLKLWQALCLLRNRRKRSKRRAFTLVELLTVVALIGVWAAAAAPTLVATVADERVSAASRAVVGLYRAARARALGRGTAVLVRWDKNESLPKPGDPSGHFTVREAVYMSGSGTSVPNCFATDWSKNHSSNRTVKAVDERSALYRPAAAKFRSPDDSDRDFADICFSARGRAFVRYDANSAFQPLTGVPRVEMTNTDTSLVRQIIIPSNGVARVRGRL